MRFIDTGLDGLWLVETEPVADDRGFFARTFCERAFAERGLEHRFVQHSRSLSHRRGTLRGLHFQRPPHAEAKLVSCAAGAIWDVAVDLRADSPTRGQWRAFELTPGNGRQLYLPAGFAHGFQTLSDDAETRYLISAFHAPSAAEGVRFDDPDLGIDWPQPPSVISDRDLAWPLLAASLTGPAPAQAIMADR
jgi:dTDP-4-dehydrorhamnose 3,5-epimerase